MSISWGAQYPKLKTNLRLAINRLKLMGKKKTEMAMKARTEIADYISANKPDRARIRVEHIIREDYMVEAFEILESYCDLLLARFGLIEQMKTLDDGIAESIISILWAAPRMACDIAEFKTISDQLTVKYGKPFAEAARGNQLEYPAKVNPKLIAKLSAAAPPKLLVERYLIEIAASAGVPFTPDPDVMRDDEVAQAERMLIDFKTQGGTLPVQEIPPAEQGYGWNVPPPLPPQNDFPRGPGFPPKGGPPPPGGSGGGFPAGGGYPGYQGGGGNGPPGGFVGGNMPPGFPTTNPPQMPPPSYPGGHGSDANSDVYEVPRKPSPPQYDHVPDYDYSSPSDIYSTPTSEVGGGGFQLPMIGPNGLPVGHGAAPGGPPGGAQAGGYPTLSQRNSVVDPAARPSAPDQSIRKADDFDDSLFPEPPKNFSNNKGGGNNGGGGPGNGGGGGGDLDFDDLAKRFEMLKKK